MAAAFPKLVSKAKSDEELEMRDDKEDLRTTSIDSQNEDENMESDSENKQERDLESDGNDPWDDLDQVKSSLRQSQVKEMKRFLERGPSEEAARAKAANAPLPVFRRILQTILALAKVVSPSYPPT